MARSAPLLVNLPFALASESAGETGQVTSVTPRWDVWGLFYMKFCDQTVAFYRLAYSEYFSSVFIIFSQVIFEHAVVGRERGEVCCFHTACYI